MIFNVPNDKLTSKMSKHRAHSCSMKKKKDVILNVFVFLSVKLGTREVDEDRGSMIWDFNHTSQAKPTHLLHWQPRRTPNMRWN